MFGALAGSDISDVEEQDDQSYPQQQQYVHAGAGPVFMLRASDHIADGYEDEVVQIYEQQLPAPGIPVMANRMPDRTRAVRGNIIMRPSLRDVIPVSNGANFIHDAPFQGTSRGNVRRPDMFAQ